MCRFSVSLIDIVPSLSTDNNIWWRTQLISLSFALETIDIPIKIMSNPRVNFNLLEEPSSIPFKWSVSLFNTVLELLNNVKIELIEEQTFHLLSVVMIADEIPKWWTNTKIVMWMLIKYSNTSDLICSFGIRLEKVEK